MRIISNFHDYYGSALGYGYDPKLVYVRERRELLRYDQSWSKDLHSALHCCLKSPPKFDDHRRGVVGFCGRIYPFWLVDGHAYYSYESLVDGYSKTEVSPESLPHRREVLKKLRGERPKKLNWRYGSPYYYYGDLDPNTWERFQKEFKSYIGDAPFVHLGAPIFVAEEHGYSGWSFVANERLSKYNFASQVDPFTAFQELAMYMGNNLANQKDPIVKVSDELKAQSKGFDKWSFRTMPGDSKKAKK